MSTEVQETTVEDTGKNEKTFTQEDVNRIVQERLSRAESFFGRRKNA